MLLVILTVIPLLTPIISGGDGGGSSPDDTYSDQAQLTSRIVHTKYGAVSGTIIHLEARHLDPVEAFKGIPYASPPVGSLRFMPPVTGALWSGIKKADRYVIVCLSSLFTFCRREGVNTYP